MKEFFYKLTGRMYLVNNVSKTIHSIENQTKVCKLDKVPEDNKQRITWKKAQELSTKGYTFCKWCFRSRIFKDHGKLT